MACIPALYGKAMLDTQVTQALVDDPSHLRTVWYYGSLEPLATEARKPMFFLKPADGAIGGHVAAAQECYRNFRDVAQRVAARSGVKM